METHDGRAERERLLVLWKARRNGRLMPARADFDVVQDLRPFLGKLLLIEIVEGGRDYRFRIFGTMIASLVQDEWQGKRLSELPAGDTLRLREMCRKVVEAQRPIEFEHSGFRARRLAACGTLMLPLSPTDADVDLIMSLVFPLRGSW